MRRSSSPPAPRRAGSPYARVRGTRPPPTVLLAAALALAAACAPDLDPPSKVLAFRLLAVRAEPSEAAAGEAVALDALIAGPARCGSDPLGSVLPDAGAPELGWVACRAATDSYTNEPTDCLDAPAFLGFGPTLAYTMPPPAPTDGGAPDPVVIGLVAADGALGVRGCLDDLAATGRPTPDRCVLALKRVRYPAGSTRNTTPRIEALSVPALARDATVTLTPAFTDDDPKAEVTFSWFATAGAFAAFRSDGDRPENDWKAPAGACAATLWLVLRDPRGGAAWLSRELLVP